MKKASPFVAMICVLGLLIPIGGCTSSQFIAVLNEVGPAVLTILQIVALVEGKTADTSLSTKVAADVAGIEKLYSDFNGATSVQTKAGIEGEINAAFTTLNGDLGTVFALAQVKDANTQAKITALIGLIQTAVNIAEAVIPSPAVAAKAPAHLTASQLVGSWNSILVAKTGNPVVDKATPHMKLHEHGKFVRVASLGFAK